MIVDTHCKLPVGYRDTHGKVWREAQLRPLCGHEEELLADDSVETAWQVSRILSSCITRIGRFEPVSLQMAQALTVADRQILLLRLRALTFGDRVQAVVHCPETACGSRVDVDFLISSLPQAADARHEYELWIPPDETHSGMPIGLRLPDGADQEALAKVFRSNPADALTRLLARCVRFLGDESSPTLEQIRALPAQRRRWIERQLETLSPMAELTMDVSCPECAAAFSVPFDIQGFFFGELRGAESLLQREVHYLAFHYHWSEAEIMAMPRHKRRRYIDVLAGEIEKLNDAAEAVA